MRDFSPYDESESYKRQKKMGYTEAVDGAVQMTDLQRNSLSRGFHCYFPLLATKDGILSLPDGKNQHKMTQW